MKLLVKSLLLATALTAFAAAGLAAPASPESVRLGPLPKEALALPADGAGRHRNGVVRALPKSVALAAWTASAEGFTTQIRVSAEGAAGLRVRLDLGTLANRVELRAYGDGKVETMTVDPARGPEAWGPWTDGDTQVIDLVSPVQPDAGAVGVGAVAHMTERSDAKAAAACTLSTSCTTGDSVLDAAINERKKSVMKLSYIDSGGSFVCTGTLIDTPQRPAPFVLTANHCIHNDAAANSIISRWFYEQTPCSASTLDPANVQVAGGMQIVFANYATDMTLLRMNGSPPAGATFAPVNNARLATGASVVNLSHPRGDPSRFASGSMVGETRTDLPYELYGVRMSRGLIEPGSSGSGLFTLSGGTLQLRGVASAADTTLSCSNPTGITVWGRMDVFGPEIAQYITTASVAPDDAPNRHRDWDSIGRGSSDPDIALNQRATAELNLGPKQINYAGDVDVFRFFVSAPTVVSAYTTGNIDTVGALLNSRGEALVASDDHSSGNLNAGITQVLQAGTYYFQVSHFDPAGTGAYTPILRADNVGPVNLTSLWWNQLEPGWGLNVDHQGNTLFATLFTYDTDGTPMWLVMSNGVKQADGSFRGDLARTTGPVFNASPWGPVTATSVGTMSIAVSALGTMQLIYTYNGVQVQKSLERQVFSSLPECGWSLFDRTYTVNLQDLWWNANEPGWGINITHQDDTLFATLFTYGADGKGRWYVMSNGARSPTSPNIFSGTLYATQAGAFNAFPWVPATTTPVGNMTLTFSTGNAGTLSYSLNGISVTKQIQRQVFATPRVACVS